MVECTILIYKGQQSRVDNEGQTNIIVISSEVDPTITRSDQISYSSFRLFKVVVSVSLVFSSPLWISSELDQVIYVILIDLT
ncbi:hypothetical protein V6N13_070839 [Hibiscus sabdariffa]|uniref:Uncharacterized protein n=1 Tax=Hibiscus sabdariffa TaxID=183260 RepID=A0ABR2TFX5_9ROSI